MGGGVLLGLLVLVAPPFLLTEGERGKRGEGEGKGGRAPLFPYGPIRPNTSPRQIPVTLRYSEKYPNHSEPFRCPNIAFQYTNLYLSTISRLLVMSVISYGTPNKLRSSNHITHNINRHRTLSVRTLRVRELCRHDRDTSPVNNQ